VSTWWVAVIAIVWYLVVGALSENALFDSLTALSLLIAFYYALTGVACAVFFRRHLTEHWKSMLFIGIGPVVGAAMLAWLLVLSVMDMSDPENSYTGQAWFGVGPPLVIGIAIAVAGVAVMLWWRRQDSAFWAERAGPVDPVLARDIHKEES
jgi:amino acid transporter